MKTLVIVFLFGVLQMNAQDTDSLARIAAKIINQERQRIGVDTLEYEADTFCFATDWADSTHRFFNTDRNLFTRDDAHRDYDSRIAQYEATRNRVWKHFGECIAFGRIRENSSPVEHFTKALFGSPDHYKVLMRNRYKRIIIGIFIKDGFFNMVVFTTTEHK